MLKTVQQVLQRDLINYLCDVNDIPEEIRPRLTVDNTSDTPIEDKLNVYRTLFGSNVKLPSFELVNNMLSEAGLPGLDQQAYEDLLFEDANQTDTTNFEETDE